MEIVDNRALVFDAPNPTAVRTSIKKAQLLPSGRVAVHWGVDEVEALRSLGVDAPAPITGRYKWTGLHKPFAHQRATAEFLSTHRKCFCFNEQGCVDSETEYLSPTGWVKISEYSGGKVAQYDPESAEIQFVDPDEYVRLPCSDMIRIKTKYGLDQLLSPEHRVLLEDGKRTGAPKRETVSAETLKVRHDRYHAGQRSAVGGTRGGTDTIALSAAAIPTTFRHTPNTSMPYTNAQLRLLVAVIADGYFGSRTNHCAVRLKKERKKARLRQLLGDAGVSYREVPCQPDGFTAFTFTSPERWKEFGPEFWCASAEQLGVVRSEVLHWDGCTTRGARFSTSSRASADFVQFAFSAGRGAGGGTARVTERTRRGATEYTVQIRDGTDRLYLRGSGDTMHRAPSTDGFKYCFRVPSTYLIFRRNGCVFASGNTGKTASAIWSADFLMKMGKVNRALVVCPLSIMDSAWRADLVTFAMHRSVSIAHGSAEKRRKIIAEGSDFVIINYDGLKIVADEIAAGGFDMFIIDEANAYKNPKTDRWKVLNKLVGPDDWLWMMTGTPAAQSPMDAYGLARLVNPRAVPRTMSSFRDTVMEQKTRFRWVPKANATDVVHSVLQPAIRFTKEECLDLPDMVYTVRTVPMTRQQETYYKKLKNDFGFDLPDAEVNAANAAVQMNKLLQVAAGAAYTEGGDVVEFDTSARYAALREAIDESSSKVLVFVPFRSVIEIVTERLHKDGISAEVISGSVPVSKRNEVFQAFQQRSDPRVLVIQPQAAAHGVTLTAADTVVWWSPTASLETFAQANARVHRAGQTRKCTVVQLHSAPAERRLYKMLRDRVDVHTDLVGRYKEILA